MDYNLTFGQGRETRKLASGDIKSGVRKEDIKDKVLQSLFDKLDNGNGILEEQELQRLELAITEAAAEDGNAGNLSEKEAKKLLKKMGLSGFKVNDLFRFLHFAKSASSKIDFTETNTDNPDEIIIHYNEDVDGSKKAETRSLETGRLVKSVITHAEGDKIFKDADNMTVGGNDDAGEYTRDYNSDGSYTDTYEDGRIKNYDADGRLINGKNSKGETWERAYNADGSCTETWSSGDVYYYDKNGKLTHGKNADGIEFKYTHNADGSYTKTCSNGEVYYYDKNDKLTHGKKADGIEFKNTYNADGSYTRTWSDGEVYYYDKNGKPTHGKLADGIEFKNTYNADGSYTRTWSDGDVYYYDKNNKLTLGKLADGTEFKNTYNADGSYTKTWSNGSCRFYTAEGKESGGKNSKGETWERAYNADGSCTETWSSGDVYYYDKNDKKTHGKLADGTNFKSIYSDDGRLKYKEFTQTNGSKYYYGANNESYVHKTVNGNIKAYAKQGETFNDTMLRLGITDPADQEVFKKANPKAYKRGYFLLADPGTVGDVYIPKSIADKLDISNILVDETAEFEKHKKAKKKSFGI